jgi:hypothetical protein
MALDEALQALAAEPADDDAAAARALLGQRVDAVLGARPGPAGAVPGGLLGRIALMKR